MLNQVAVVYSIFLLVFGNIISGVLTAELYPFGTRYGDSILQKNDDGGTSLISISTPFPYFDNNHQGLYVNTNGVISFLKQVSQFTPDAFPLNGSRRLITPFWGDIDTTRGGSVLYRETTNVSVLQRASQEIRNAFVTHTHFTATWAFVATWDNVAFYGSRISSWTPRNTFQVVLVTNVEKSFVIFNYFDIKWTTGTSSGGDRINGLGGTPAQAGFNAGDGIRYFSIPGSRTPAIVDVETTTNVGIPGKWIFQVDEGEVEAGGCSETGYLHVSPSYASLLGGEPILVSGPCFSPNDNIKCRFGDQIVDGLFVGKLKTKCYTPLSLNSGRIKLSVSTNGGINFTQPTDFTIVYDEARSPDITRIDHPAWDSNGPYRLAWNAMLLNSSRVDIHVLGFGDGVSNDAMKFELAPVYRNIENDGEAEIDLESLDSEINDRFTMSSGFVRITPTGSADDNFKIYNDDALWSDPHVILWYTKYLITQAVFNHQNRQKRASPGWSTVPKWWDTLVEDVSTIGQQLVRFGKKEVYELLGKDTTRLGKGYCKQWFQQDIQKPLPTDLSPCPCTRNQGRVAVGYEADRACNNGNGCNNYHPGAFNCIRSSRCSPSGAGQQCCFNQNGDLLDAANSPGGGTLDRAHWFGCNGQNKKIIVISHYAEDVVPFNYCCKWSGDSNFCRETYMRRRPSTDCSQFDPPRPAGGWGDPHITTLDGFKYTFNGLGEYILIRVSNGSTITFMMQGRAVQAKDNKGSPAKATIWSALAVQGKNTSRVQVETSDRRVVDVLIDGQRINFYDLMSQDFAGVTVEHNSSAANVNVFFTDDRVSIDVRVVGGALNFVSYLTARFKEKTSGLLGVWNEDTTDDLISRTGVVLPISSSNQNIHDDFGESWRTLASESIFSYPPGKTHTDYQDHGFRPLFIKPGMLNNSEAVQLCGDNTDCLFDYSATGKKELALGSKQAAEEYEVVVKDTKRVVACPFLPVPQNGSKSGDGIQVGSTVTFSCDSDHGLKGSETRVCQNDGTWNGVTVECVFYKTEIPISDSMDPAVVAAIIGSCFGVIGVIAVVLSIICWKHHSKK